MAEIHQDIVTWLHGRQDWLQEAALRLLAKGELNEHDIAELAAFLKTDQGQRNTNSRSFPGLVGASSLNALRLLSIGDIEGIENLAPRSPLTFRGRNLAIVYGGNGSGKSGYARILKKACGKANAMDLKPNAFQPKPKKQCCTITYSLDGVSSSVSWEANASPIDALRSMDVFDSSCGKLYLDGETELTYAPPEVTLFEDLVKTCERIRSVLESEQRTLVSGLPPLPNQFAGTPTGKVYSSLQPSQTQSCLERILVWSEGDKQNLALLEQRLNAEDPAALARQKRSLKRQLDELRDSICAARAAVSPEACRHLDELRRLALEGRRAAVESAHATTQSSKLGGIGEDTWRRMWEAARAYSTEVAYPALEFPHLAENARCVLCHQKLSPEARDRLRDFDRYVCGALEAAAAAAEDLRDLAIKSLPSRPTDDALRAACHAAGLHEDRWSEVVRAAWDTIKAAVDEASKADRTGPAKGIDHCAFRFLEEMAVRSGALEREAAQLDKDVTDFDRAKAQADRLDLQAKEWTAQQATAILSETERLGKAALYEKWKSLTHTAAISHKAGIIAENLITSAYIERFNHELARLGAKHIQVELTRTRTERGRPKHRIQLRGLRATGTTPGSILSEGECRIVTLAAFLADVASKSQPAPFVFDDPISSLDQGYEEKTALRLVELSADRQVIVFTHRLSFLGIMCEQAEPEQVHLTLELWGAGEPGQVPLFAKKPEGALKNLRNDRLVKAQETLSTEGKDAYYLLGTSICSDFRILLERVVETVLLADVVQRHRREVQTKGKVMNLCKITPEDCALMDKMMSTYSRFVHSQSDESPVDIPAPSDITSDIDRLLAWHDEFRARKLPSKAS